MAPNTDFITGESSPIVSASCSIAPPSSRPDAPARGIGLPGGPLGRADLRAPVDPDARLLRGGRRRARRHPDRPARRRDADQPRRVARRRRPRALPLRACDRDPLGLGRAGRGARRGGRRPRDQRPHAAPSPLPGARRPADAARALRRARRAAARLRRRRQQRRPLARAARRRGRRRGGRLLAAGLRARGGGGRRADRRPARRRRRRRRRLRRRLVQHGRRGRRGASPSARRSSPIGSTTS